MQSLLFLDLKDMFLRDFDTYPESERRNIHCNIFLFANVIFFAPLENGGGEE